MTGTGYMLRFSRSFVKFPDLQMKKAVHELSVTLWVAVIHFSGNGADILRLRTDRGDLWLTLPSSVSISGWVYVCMSWRSYDGRLKVMAKQGDGVIVLKETYAVYIGKPLLPERLNLGEKASGDVFQIDYVQMWDFAMEASNFALHQTEYIVEPQDFVHNNELKHCLFVIAFDEGKGPSLAMTVFGDVLNNTEPHLKEHYTLDGALLPAKDPPTWLPSDVPMNYRYTVGQALSTYPPATVDVCEDALQAAISNSPRSSDACADLGSGILQFYMEACMREVSSTGQESAVHAIASLYAYVCQGVTGQDGCFFNNTLLVSCPMDLQMEESGGSLWAKILGGIVGGILLVVIICLVVIFLKSKKPKVQTKEEERLVDVAGDKENMRAAATTAAIPPDPDTYLEPVPTAETSFTTSSETEIKKPDTAVLNVMDELRSRMATTTSVAPASIRPAPAQEAQSPAAAAAPLTSSPMAGDQDSHYESFPEYANMEAGLTAAAEATTGGPSKVAPGAPPAPGEAPAEGKRSPQEDPKSSWQASDSSTVAEKQLYQNIPESDQPDGKHQIRPGKFKDIGKMSGDEDSEAEGFTRNQSTAF